MGPRLVNEEYRRQTGADRSPVDPSDPDTLLATVRSGFDGEARQRDVERRRQGGEQLTIRRPFDGSRTEPHAHGVAMEPRNPRLRRPRPRVHAQDAPVTRGEQPAVGLRQRRSR